LEETFLLCRKEARIPVKMFVNLYDRDNPTFELARTIDISCHGARVLTKKIWQPDQPLSVRSIRGETIPLSLGSRCIIRRATGQNPVDLAASFEQRRCH
jgi:PilZ domain-containing protein